MTESTQPEQHGTESATAGLDRPASSPSPSPMYTEPSASARIWWVVRSVSQPLLFFAAGAALLGLLGIAQKAGWISAGGSGGSHAAAGTAAPDVDYICPMMCTPPQHEPGRCPVCAMELVPASTGGGGDERSVVVDPASRRVSNIQTVAVRTVPMSRTIKAVGELQYDEGTLRTISAYTDGRFDKLYVDFTGAVVKAGEPLAEFYSPELHSAQVEYLQSGRTVQAQSSKSLASVARINRRLYSNSRQRLIELGMSEGQITELDRTEEAQSRMDIVAPMSGTVIEKLAVEGEYVKEGQRVFRLADLSTVWLMLELFPEDVPCVCYGQAVEATVKSLPGRTFTGRIAFIDPDVDRKSRTVSVRVVIDNADGLLRIGDYAKASITVSTGSSHGEHHPIYDAELANKWISPRYPHILSDEPGLCQLSGMELVPTSSLGFVDQAQATATATVVPRNAVLMAASHSVVYVETEPGRFEIRRIVTGSTSGEDIVVVKGLAEGEVVATAGNFLLDSQMQLAGNPSLIDPTRAVAPLDMVPGFDAIMLAALQQLPKDDQSAAMEQVICPVTNAKLGSMGAPVKLTVDGAVIFLCCEGCRDSVLEDPQAHLLKLQQFHDAGDKAAVGGNDVPLPAIGAIETDFDADAFPAIGEMEILAPVIPEIDGLPVRSASTEAESGRIE
jgi:membrane fusion protein, copper/silver efflux system